MDSVSQTLELEQRLGSIFKGTYRLERLLGMGGMGAVYEASDSAGQRFAVKFVHQSLAQSEEHVARFLREARIGELLNSKHVVPVVDCGREAESVFLVMPLLHGHDLAALLERTGPLRPELAGRLALQACDGLAVAHRCGVVHRDIKPSNLFLQYRPDGEVVLRIADFGVAKRAEMYDESNLTRTGASLGSPLYMSPEQVLNAKIVDARSDIWSLAATFYELLAGTTPHGDAKTLADLMIRITSRNAPSIQERAPWLSPDFALALHQALHRDPNGRFETIEAFAAALRACGITDSRVLSNELTPLSDAERAVSALSANIASVSASEGPVTSAGQDDPLIGKSLGGRYSVLRLLGRGGMGGVYEAETDAGARVALKVISPQAAGEGPESARRFLREARASRAIDSPHVVKTLDAGTDESTGLPFIVMELLRGVDFAVLLKRQGALIPAVVVRVLIQAARGVMAAHAQGVVHRDIKPANLFLSVTPGDPKVTVKVCDFGIAKRLFDDASDPATRELTRTGGMLGSPMYMSPEQATNAKNVDHRTDVWSLAISLFEGLSARRPWDDRTTLGQILVAICTAPVPPLQDYAPWIEPGLAEVVHHALEKDPEQRPGSVAELIARLEPFAGGTADIARDQLRGIDFTTRAQVASRSTLVRGVASVNEAFTQSVRPRSTAKKTAMAVLGIVAVVVVGVVGAAGYSFQTRGAGAESPPPPVVTPEEPKAVRLRIQPEDARATVDGQPVEVAGGEVVLRGRPGDSFAVAITKDGHSRSATVVLARDGTPNPKELVIAPPPAAIGSGPGQPPPPPRERRVAGASQRGKDSAGSTKPAPGGSLAAAARAPEPPVASSSQPKVVPVQEW